MANEKKKKTPLSIFFSFPNPNIYRFYSYCSIEKKRFRVHPNYFSFSFS